MERRETQAASTEFAYRLSLGWKPLCRDSRSAVVFMPENHRIRELTAMSGN
jgi:hypothetical protein